MKYHLAQINIAHGKAGMDSALMQGFVDRLDEINALADGSPGFVWRLRGDDGSDATTIQAFDDPLLLVNMSVWEDLASLKQYVYKSVHVELIRDREAWFNKMIEAHQALWWVPEGHIPSVAEGKEKLEQLQQNGPGSVAFSFAKPAPYPLK
ncbi:MAG: Unknown protein [uncultured Thiotrichaceae bacterium]|uniref:DUF3291 domain-containing protein n=1 Tax=uncultured Thiotrichaceae bacterium TaxID=298394 RepID=A0A6S6TZH9_9GAMM|nr:MAG: Unknown protein [uncultured Thiotrichaceae bacterium]